VKLVLGAAVVAALAVPASASAQSSYCSPTGDFCTSAARVKHVRYLRLSTFSFRGQVRICVRDPRNLRTCHGYPLRKDGPLYTVAVKWKGHFPNAGPGLYRVVFFLGTTRLGPILTFTLRR
jgi:hypothetical protein